jgi:Tol biopolymer transport system component
MTRTLRWIVIGVFAAVLAGTQRPAAQSKGDIELRAAMETETVKGDLTAAIKQYQVVVDKFSKTDRATAATALLRMAECYTKLGDASARSVYEKIIGQFDDQRDAVTTARARLMASTPSAVTNAATTRQVWSAGAGSADGISRDGRYVFGAARDHIEIRDMTTGEVKRLVSQSVDSFPDYPVLSPDALQIAYAAFPNKGPATLNVVTNQAGGSPRVLVNNLDIEYLVPRAWSPDGKSILTALRRRDKTWQIAWVSAATGAVTVLRSLDWRFNESGFSLSPDGRYVAFAAFPVNPGKPNAPRTEAPDIYIYVVPSDGVGQETAVVQTAGWNEEPVWAPDGTHIVFLASATVGGADLWFVPVRNGRRSDAPQLVKRDVGHIFPVGMTSSGSYYYTTDASPNWDVSIVSLTTGDSGGSRLAVSPIPGGMNAGWSPDGKSVALRTIGGRESDGNHYELIVYSLETGEGRTFSLDGLVGGPNAPLWLHDGASLLVPTFTRTPSRQTWQRLDLKTGKSAEVTTVHTSPTEGFGAVALSSDDRTLYGSKRRTGDGSVTDSLVALDIITGRERQLLSSSKPESPEDRPSAASRLDIGRLFLSPDNHTLVYSTAARTGAYQFPGVYRPVVNIWRIGTDGNDARELYTPPPGTLIDLLGWAPDGRSILFEQQRQIMRIPADRGPAAPTGQKIPNLPAPPAPLPSLFLSPDGTRLAITRFGGTSALWAIDNLQGLLNTGKR